MCILIFIKLIGKKKEEKVSFRAWLQISSSEFVKKEIIHPLSVLYLGQSSSKLPTSPDLHLTSPPVGLWTVPRPDGMCSSSSMFWGCFPFGKCVFSPPSLASHLVLAPPKGELRGVGMEAAINRDSQHLSCQMCWKQTCPQPKTWKERGLCNQGPKSINRVN